jgi:hypothetical protein
LPQETALALTCKKMLVKMLYWPNFKVLYRVLIKSEIDLFIRTGKFNIILYSNIIPTKESWKSIQEVGTPNPKMINFVVMKRTEFKDKTVSHSQINHGWQKKFTKVLPTNEEFGSKTLSIFGILEKNAA